MDRYPSARRIRTFFLIDHGSTDDWSSKISDYVARGIVTVRSVPNQNDSHDNLRVDNADFALDESEWLLVQDLDEFTYATGHDEIAAVLKSFPDDVHQVVVPWIVFGTGGNVVQPKYVVKGRTKAEDMTLRCVLDDSQRPWHVKSIIRSRYLDHMRVHIHDVVGRTVLPLEECIEVDGNFYISNRYAERIMDFKILQNHYIHQSWEFYVAKMQRKGYWLEQNRGTKSYTIERFEREEPILNAVSNTFLLEKHWEYYSHVAVEAD